MGKENKGMSFISSNTVSSSVLMGPSVVSAGLNTSVLLFTFYIKDDIMSNKMPEHVVSIGVHSQPDIPTVSDITQVLLHSICKEFTKAGEPVIHSNAREEVLLFNSYDIKIIPPPSLLEE